MDELIFLEEGRNTGMEWKREGFGVMSGCICDFYDEVWFRHGKKTFL